MTIKDGFKLGLGFIAAQFVVGMLMNLLSLLMMFLMSR